MINFLVWKLDFRILVTLIRVLSAIEFCVWVANRWVPNQLRNTRSYERRARSKQVR